MKLVFALNPHSRPQLGRVGAEGEPVVILDDVFLHPERIVEFAAEATTFGPGGAGYPGLRAAVPDFVNHALFFALRPLLAHVFQLGDDDDVRMTSSYAIITEKPQAHWVGQLLPHFDTMDAKALATVVYLCDPALGGTAFYRHRSTGYETVSPERSEDYNRRLADELSRTKLPLRFPDEHHPLFEQFCMLEARFNRLVLYRSRLLHSAAVSSDRPLIADPRGGRLTITSFITPS